MRRYIHPATLVVLAASALVGCGGLHRPAANTSPRPAAAAAATTTGPTTTTFPARAELVANGPREARLVALTFDADMTPGMRAKLESGRMRAPQVDTELIGVLHATRTPATIFVTGLWAEAYPDVVTDLAADPLFEVENHSWDHLAWSAPCFGLPVVPPERHTAEVAEAAALLQRLTGHPTHWFRFPGGCHSAEHLATVAAAGHTPVQWDVESGDAFATSPEAVARQVEDSVQPGSIVVMHFNGAPNAPATAAAVALLVPRLREMGYDFVTLDTLLAAE